MKIRPDASNKRGKASSQGQAKEGSDRAERVAKTKDLVEFRKIEILTDSPLDPGDIALIDGLFREYPAEEIHYELAGGYFVFFLNRLDFGSFKKAAAAISENGASVQLRGLLESLIIEIEAIGSYGIKGKKRAYVGYNSERKVKERKKKEKNRSRFFYAGGSSFSETNADLPADFENRIICGDSLEVLRKLPDNCVDLVFTSPPYNFGLDYESGDDAHRWDNYFSKLFAIFDQCVRVLKFGGRIAINIQPLFSDYIPSHHIISNFLMSRKLIWKGEILWEKNNYNCKYTAWGSWKSPSNPYLKYTWEFIEIFAKGSLKKEGDSAKADITGDEFKEWVLCKWSIAPERNMKEFGHPAMFPEELAKRIIKLFSFENDVVLDPFNGVGTTTFVARRYNRRFIGIDISEDYCEKSVARLGSSLIK